MRNTFKKKPSSTSNKVKKEAYKDFLKRISLFTDFDDVALERILDKAIVTEYSKGKLLFLNGEKAESFYIIINGLVKIFRETRDGHESIISILTEKEIFGKSAVLNQSYFLYSAEVIEDSLILKIPASFMLEMAKNYEHFDDFLHKFLESQIKETNQRCLEVEHLAHMTSTQRVGCFLLKMCKNKQEGSISFNLPYDKALIAGRLCMTPETFSRSLNQINALGVENHHSKITINNIEQLQSRVCEHCSAMKLDCEFGENDEEY